ncbi:DNA-binding transcriptional regulator, AcrR family [Leucobacter chromiiresistens]|uniref:DNA-binding transcriptional regulator, AcrR family n=1 Tax=Leucobacter chromiiresistens TaxID=1079994 RepID=A0A1H0Y321_9MICO|nr:DNA-binding transcriptional regulator, AcrR family [Leucobacter chromiiresistens]
MRSEAARQAILQAAIEMLAERGYDHLAIEGIASRAGVGKQTIYRWWKSKSAIIAEALLEGMILGERLEVPDTGDVRRDLTTWLRAVGDVLLSPQGEGLVRSLIAAATDNADVGQRLRDAIAGSGSGALSTRLAAAIGSEPHLPEGAPIDDISEALVGALLLRALSRSPLDDHAIAALVVVAVGPPRA